MSFAYNNTAATAGRLLARFGAAATLKRQTAGAYDPDTGTTPVTVTELDTTACVFDYPHGYIDGTLIQAGDRRAYLVANAEPNQGDILAWSGRDLTVVTVKPLAPAGTVVLYEAQVRG